MKKAIVKKLIKLSVLTSPLIGAVNIAPLKIVADTGEFEQIKEANFFLGTFILSLGVFILWQINIFIFYQFNRPRFKDNRIIKFVISFFFVFSLIFILYSFRDGTSPLQASGLHLFPLFSIVVSNTFILIFIQFIIQKEEYVDVKLEKANLEFINLQSRHESLKQQIQPHFLFNCLSNLRSLIQFKDDRALDYSDQLSSFLRKSIEYSNQNIVTLEEELEFVENYLTLQRTRFQNSLNYSEVIHQTIKENTTIPIFSIQTLVENAIKHNGFTRNNPLFIEISYNDKKHAIQVKNNRIKKYETQNTTGTGLINLKERFEIENLNPPTIIENELEFIIEIQLK